VVVSFFLWIHCEIQPYRPTQFLPELIVIFELGKVDLVDDLAEICLVGYLQLLLHIFHIGFMEMDTIRVAFFHEVQELRAYQHDRLVPFTLDLVRFLMVNGGENLCRGQDSVGQAKTWVEVVIFSQFQSF
jgi:hypothetical protein